MRNGSPFLGEQQALLPRQTVLIGFAGGPGLVPADREGLCSIAARILGSGSAALKDDGTVALSDWNRLAKQLGLA